MSPIPKIEASERGITINKALAWTIVTGLVLGGVWVGTTVATTAGKIDNLATQITALNSDASDREIRLRSLEAANVGASVQATNTERRIDALTAVIAEVQRDQREANQLLRTILQRLTSPDQR